MACSLDFYYKHSPGWCCFSNFNVSCGAKQYRRLERDAISFQFPLMTFTHLLTIVKLSLCHVSIQCLLPLNLIHSRTCKSWRALSVCLISYSAELTRWRLNKKHPKKISLYPFQVTLRQPRSTSYINSSIFLGKWHKRLLHTRSAADIDGLKELFVDCRQ